MLPTTLKGDIRPESCKILRCFFKRNYLISFIYVACFKDNKICKTISFQIPFNSMVIFLNIDVAQGQKYGAASKDWAHYCFNWCSKTSLLTITLCWSVWPNICLNIWCRMNLFFFLGGGGISIAFEFRAFTLTCCPLRVVNPVYTLIQNWRKGDRLMSFPNSNLNRLPILLSKPI